MSDVKKIDISTTNNFQSMMDSFRNVAVNQSNLNQGITVETIDMEALDVVEDLNVVDNNQEIKTSYTKEDLDGIIAEYRTQRKGEIEEYNKILVDVETELENLEKIEKELNNINDSSELTESHINDYVRDLALGYQVDYAFDDAKLKELGLTEEELLNMPLEELIEICKEKDSQVTDGFQNLDTLQNDLDAKVQELTEFENYDEFHEYMENLRSDQMTLTSAIQKTNELIDCAEYNFIPLLEEYQNYTYKEATINDLNNKDVSPLEKFRALNQTYSRYNIALENKGKLENLLKASEIEPELAKMYNYLYDYQGEEAATTYLFSIESTINQINGKQKAEKFLNSLTEERNAEEVLENHLKTSGKGLVDGGESFLEGIAAWIKSSRIYTADEYESMYILQALQNDEKYDFLLDDNYQISQSIGNMLPSVALSMVLSPAVGTVTMGVSTGGNNYHGALVEGQSVGKSVTYGVLSGLSEAALERLLGGIPGLGDVDVKSLKTFAQAMVQEGIEEGTQEHIDALMRAGIFKEDYDIAEVNKNAAKSAIYGAITAGIMNAPNLATSSINKGKEQNNAILDDSNNLKLEDLKYNNHSLLESVRYTLESNLKKYVYSNTNNFTGLNESIMKNGLYHFSNSVDSILDSGYIKPSGINSSYGNPKVFFFSGIPTVGSVATNLDTIPLTATAIKINPDMNLLNDAKIKVRNLDDGAISYDGKFDLTNQNVSKEYFCLTKVGDELIYKPVSKEIYENYANTEEGLRLSEFLNNKKNVQAIKDDYLYSLSNKMNNADETYKISTEGLPKEKANIIEQWNNDGFVNMDTGKKIATLFKNQDYIYGVHRTSHNEVANNILKNGLNLTGHLSSGIREKNIDLTENISFTDNSKDNNFQLAKFLRDIKSAGWYKNHNNNVGYAMIVKIPKSAITTVDNVTSSKLIDFSNGYPTLKPEFIVGKIEVNNGNINDSINTIFKEESVINNSMDYNIKPESVVIDGIKFEENELFFPNMFEQEIDDFYNTLDTYGINQGSIKEKLSSYTSTEERLAYVKKLKETFLDLYYPNLSFEEAYKYISAIDVDRGVCSYATTLSQIISIFKDNLTVFEKFFHYPMYEIKDGKRILNSDLMLMDLYSFVNRENKIQMQNGELKYVSDKSTGWIKDDTISLNAYSISENIYQTSTLHKDLLQKFLNSKGLDIEVQDRFLLNSQNSSYSDMLEIVNKNVSNSDDYEKLLKDIRNAIAEGEQVFIEGKNTKLYFNYIEKNGQAKSRFQLCEGAHSMYITGTTESGHLIVNTWGKKRIILKNDIISNPNNFLIASTKFIKK